MTGLGEDHASSRSPARTGLDQWRPQQGLGAPEIAPRVPIRPADRADGLGQRAATDDALEQVEPAVADDEAAIDLEPELGLDLGAHYVLVSRLKPTRRAGNIALHHRVDFRPLRHGQLTPHVDAGIDAVSATVTRAGHSGRVVMGRVSRILMLLSALLLTTASVAAAQELTFSVAISMKEAVEELGRQFVKGRPGVTLRYNFGSSGELQKQIEAAAPVDLFVSAAQRQMDDLERQGLIVPASRRVFARNVLVAIKPADSALDLS